MKLHPLALAVVAVACFAAAAPAVEPARIDNMLKQVLAQQAQNPHEGHGHAPKPDTEALRKSITRELQTMEVLKAEALKAGLDKQPDIQNSFKNLEAQFYAAQYVEHLRNQIQINDADLRATYEQLNREIKLQQVQFATAAEAKQAQALLLKGLSFEELMKRFPNPEQNFNNWLAPQQLPPELAAVIMPMTRGEVTREPLLFNDKYYVFKVAAVQQSDQAPPFEQVKPQLQEAAKQQKVSAELEKLLKANGIE